MERVLVVPAAKLFEQIGFVNGFHFVRNEKELERVKQVIRRHHRFAPRPQGANSVVEHDSFYKQFITYGIFFSKESDGEAKIFIYKRNGLGSSDDLGDDRLLDVYSIGIGGHIKHTDKLNERSIMLEGVLSKSIWREIKEEVEFSKCNKPRFIGFVNFDHLPINPYELIRENERLIGTKTKIERTHFGLVYLIQVSPDIKISKNEADKNTGFLIPASEVTSFLPQMEPWSKAIWEELSKRYAPLFGSLHQ